MEKGKQSGRETEETEQLQLQEHIVQAVLLAAGAAVLMACFKRAVLVFLTEQWRAWIFLVLNLVLLAIVFTSISSTSKPENRQCNNNNAEVVNRIERKMKMREFYRYPAAEEAESEDKSEEVAPLSKEALNERVEAFIVMFRQHLASDARN